jgi:hypothetical protein
MELLPSTRATPRSTSDLACALNGGKAGAHQNCSKALPEPPTTKLLYMELHSAFQCPAVGGHTLALAKPRPSILHTSENSWNIQSEKQCACRVVTFVRFLLC